MRRVDRFALAALGLTGCMRIYPDPELPDVTVVWGDQDCRDGTGNVAITLTGVDTPSTATTTVPCTDHTVAFPDVARQRFHVAGSLLDLAGDVFSTSESDVDLRNGFDQETGLYFDGFSNFRVAWTFEGGGTCASTGAEGIEIQFSLPGEPNVAGFQIACEPPLFLGTVPPATYTVQLRALASGSVIAISPDSAPVDVTAEGFTDLGIVTLAPCGAACP